MDTSDYDWNLSGRDKILGYVNFAKEYFNAFMRYRRRYRNYVSVIYRVLNNSYPLQAVLKNGEHKQFSRQEQIWLDIAEFEYDSDKDVVYLNDLHILGGTTNGDLVNIFYNKDYGMLQVRDRVVLDIGTNIGDSAIYFVLQGAKKVHAIEPNKDLYKLAEQNLVQNNLCDRIVLYWMGCSSKTDRDRIPEFVSLEDFMTTNNINPDILKLDCEGCEYDVLINSPDTLIGSFRSILVEYHYGYRNIKDKLERCGFRTRVTRPTFRGKSANKSNLNVYFSTQSLNQKNMYVGYLLASKDK
jgi:hypothetical protein